MRRPWEVRTSNPAPDMWAWIKGALKSWSVWVGAAILSMPDWYPIISPELKDFLDAHSTAAIRDMVIRALGMVVILVRFKTDRSLKDKGSA